MPTLKDPRHEKFLFELVVNKENQTDAYISAGFNAKSRGSARTAAARLFANVNIQARYKEMLTEFEAKQEVKAELIAIERRENEVLTLEAHMANLLTIRDSAIADGKWDAALKAEVKRGELKKYYVKQVEHGDVGEFDAMNADELRHFIAERAKGMGLAVQPPGSDRGKGTTRGKPH